MILSSLNAGNITIPSCPVSSHRDAPQDPHHVHIFLNGAIQCSSATTRLRFLEGLGDRRPVHVMAPSPPEGEWETMATLAVLSWTALSSPSFDQSNNSVKPVRSMGLTNRPPGTTDVVSRSVATFGSWCPSNSIEIWICIRHKSATRS